jgi:hypothetical protein
MAPSENNTKLPWLRRLAAWLGISNRRLTPAPVRRRNRLGFDTLETRDVMSGSVLGSTLLPDLQPRLDAVPVVSTTISQPATQDTALNSTRLLTSTTSGVTAATSFSFTTPTAYDRLLMQRLVNKKWQLRTSGVNPFTGNAVKTITEMVLQSGRNFTMITMSVEQTIFGKVRYYAGSSGKWQVQNNGRLVLRHDNPWPAEYWVKWQFMRLRSVTNSSFVSPDSGTWNRIPLGSTGIRGL